MQDERCPNNEGEGVMYEVGDKHACLHGPLQPRNMGLPPMAHGFCQSVYRVDYAMGRAGSWVSGKVQ